MKKLVSMIAALMICAVFMVSCGGNETPTQVVEKFYKAMTTGDINTIKAVTEGLSEEAYAEFQEEAKRPETQKISIKIISEQIAPDGKTATVKAKLLLDGQEIEDEEIKLVKIGTNKLMIILLADNGMVKETVINNEDNIPDQNIEIFNN